MNEGGSSRATSKKLVTLIIAIVAIAPVLAVTLTSSQSQQNSVLNRTAKEGSPPTTTYWANTYGGNLSDLAQVVRQTSDGGYIVGGYTGSFGAGLDDIWLLKLNSTGSVMWQKTYGGNNSDWLYSAEQTSDGGYILLGDTWSFGAGWEDFWVLKLDSTGSVTWQNTFGESTWNDEAYSVQQTVDAGCIVAGSTDAFGAGGQDAWVVKLNASDYIAWDAGSGASTQTTSITPADSNVTASWTSVTPLDSAATVTSTTATVQETHVIITAQSGGTDGSGRTGPSGSGPGGTGPNGGGPGGTGPGGGGVTDAFPLMIMLVAPVALVLIALVVIRARRISTEETSPLSWNDENTSSKVKSRVVHGEAIGICTVCNLRVYDREGTVWCPFCGHVFHRIHLLEWIHVKSCCPVCQNHLTEEDLR